MVACELQTKEVRAEVKRLLPPDERDQEIFRRVRGGRESQAAVAKEYGLSQPRVSQIVEQVLAWLVEATPAETGELPPEKRLRLGSYLVRMRLECLLDMTMQSWRNSQGNLTTTKSRDDGATDRVTKPSFGDVKYLTAFRHVALALARLDGVPTAPKVEPVVESARQPAESDLYDLYPESPAEAASEPVAAEAVVETPVVAKGSEAEPSRNSASQAREIARQRAYKQAWNRREKRRERAAQRSQLLHS